MTFGEILFFFEKCKIQMVGWLVNSIESLMKHTTLRCWKKNLSITLKQIYIFDGFCAYLSRV